MSESTLPPVDTDEAFEALGRRAGAELRRPAPEGSLSSIERRAASRRRSVGAAVVVAVVAIAGVLAALVVGSDDSPVASTADAVIAYQEDLGSRIEVFTVRMDGSDRRSIGAAVRGGNQVNPDWSPDGKRVAFGAANGTRESIWVTDADGSAPEELVPCTDDCLALLEPAWSPDGRQIMFSRLEVVDGVGRGTLEKVDVASGELTVLATAAPGKFFAGPRWSPTGDRVVLEVVDDPSGDFSVDPTDVVLAVLDLTTTPATSTVITQPGLWTVTSDWSPDGTTIVYSALPFAGASSSDLYLIDPDGTNGRRLTTLSATGGSADEPTFSPDGSVVVFVATIDGESGVLAQIPVTGGDITPAGSEGFRQGRHPDLTPG